LLPRITRNLLMVFVCLLLSLGFPTLGYCADTFLDGTQLSIIWTLPFLGLLLSIALWPMISAIFWEENYGKITLFWSAILITALVIKFGPSIVLQELLGVIIVTYLPFIMLLTALFTVTGGIHLRGSLKGTPLLNTGILLIGTLIASWVGTTGASMLLIRPLLKANIYRRYRVHSVIFFIILVANIGGTLTPLGDPPIFLGFLAGVDFFWTARNLFWPMLFLCSVLLVLHFIVDSWLYKKEDDPHPKGTCGNKRLGVEGWQINLPLLAAIAGAVLLSGFWKPGIQFNLYGAVVLELQNIVRDVLLLLIIIASGKFTNLKIRIHNSFTWDPMREVAKLFLGIFIGLSPVIAILKAGEDGSLGFIINVLNSGGQPNNAIYFWVTGILSTFLDNAPTYLVFFNVAGGNAEMLMTYMPQTLLAITCGTVFMGANTYISNAPNLMVRSMAENTGVRMPSFFVYMGIIMALLFPLYAIFTLIWLT